MVNACIRAHNQLEAINKRQLHVAIIGAGAILTQDKTVPARMLAIGIPAKVGREVSDAEHEAVAANAARYVAYGAEHRDEHDLRFSASPGGAV
jgi:hypothetical protein